MNWLVRFLDAWWAGRCARYNKYWDQFEVGDDWWDGYDHGYAVGSKGAIKTAKDRDE